MRPIASGLLAASLLFAAGAVCADDDTKDQVKQGTVQTGKTVKHGAAGVGKGASKIYHDAALNVHKFIGHNSKSKHSRAVHQTKAAKHHSDAARKSKQSDKEMGQSKDHADDVAPKK